MTLPSTLRFTWAVPRPADLPAGLEGALFTLVCAKHPLRPGTSQDESLHVEAVEPSGEGFLVRGSYVFDHDFASQYDKTERWAFAARVDAHGACTLLEFVAG